MFPGQPGLKEKRAGEMAQRIRALAAIPYSRGPEFNCQQPHGGSQPSVTKSDAFFWHTGIHAGRILYI